MKKILPKVVVRLLRALLYGALGAIMALAVVGIKILNSKPDLEIWHEVTLEEEFRAGAGVETFPEYLKLEERLFAELDKKVYDRATSSAPSSIDRFQRGSLSDPGRWPRNWNRSYERVPEGGATAANIGVLLIHGLSDSPYSLHTIGETLHERGAHVVGLRVPGHGTAPAALTETRWQDMAAAVEIGVRHLKETPGDRPLHIIGYSNGAALALHYALSAIEDDALPRLDGIVLISPQIGVSAIARLASWQDRIGGALGLGKLAWESVRLEYDPYKYNSFPINAASIAHQLTTENRSRMARLHDAGRLDAFPPVLGFQSVADATVSAPAVVSDLFVKLPDNGHELVAFGLNLTTESEPLLKDEPRTTKGNEILEDPERSFVFSLVSNASAETSEVVVRSWAMGAKEPTEQALGLSWPENVHSLSHVSLPFRKDDPLYGARELRSGPGIHLGDASLRGERDVIRIPPGELLRQRWNPFYAYLEERLLGHLGLLGVK